MYTYIPDMRTASNENLGENSKGSKTQFSEWFFFCYNQVTYSYNLNVTVLLSVLISFMFLFFFIKIAWKLFEIYWKNIFANFNQNRVIPLKRGGFPCLTYTYTFLYPYRHTYMQHSYIHMHTYTHTYIHIHTFTYTYPVTRNQESQSSLYLCLYWQ